MVLTILSTTAAIGQETEKKRRHFSPEEFQKKQKEFIMKKAEMTDEQAEAFFPLFFELQKKKFELEGNARREMKFKRKEKPTDEQCRKFVNKMAEVKVEIAKLEQAYIEKYLEVVPPCKLLEIQHAEGMFQRHLMKEMMQHRGKRGWSNEKR